MTTSHHQSRIERFATTVSSGAGNSRTFLTAVALVLFWLVTWPIFDYSTNRQLIINTGTTIITFLMVFLIQKTANKDNLAIQLKLNELIACTHAASNRVINIEDLSEDELKTIHAFYQHLASFAKEEKNLHTIYSIDAARSNHTKKKKVVEESKHIAQLLETILSEKKEK